MPSRLWRVLFILLLAIPWLGSTAEKLSSVHVVLAPQTISDLPLKGTLKLRPRSGDGTLVSFPVEASHLSLELPPGTWEATLEIPGYWGARKSLTVPHSGEDLVFAVWPLGKISGKLRTAEKNVPLPKKVSLTTLAPPPHLKRSAVPKGLLNCPVDKKGSWTCELPADTFDVVISADGFIPIYRWGLEVPPAKTRDLGTLELKRGASVAGWVVVEDGSLEPEKCLARLGPLPSAAAGALESLDLARVTAEQKVRKDGFFQFVNVAPGSYLLEVRQPGFAPAKVFPVQVWPKAETFVRDPVALQRAFTMSLSASPPLDWLGKPWHFQVIQRPETGGRLGAVVFKGSAGMEGNVAIPDQSPGDFRVTVSDSLGNSVLSELLTVTGTADAQRAFELELLTVQGKVTLGREPLAATLWFGGRSGAPAVKMESDEEGRFHGILPQKTLWVVDVAASDPELDTRTRIEVRPDRSGRAEIEISLPDTRIFGRVVEESGRPVASAYVVFVSSGVEMTSMTDEAGGFEKRALPPGVLLLGAEGEPGSKATTGLVQVTLSEDQTVGPIELRLLKTRSLQGKVVSPRGPVPAAKVVVQARDPSPDSGDSSLTDLDGVFRVKLTDRTRTATVIVSAPGSALQAFLIDVNEGKPLLRIGDEAGILEVVLPSSSEELTSLGLTAAFFQNGLSIPAGTLTAWASRHPGGGSEQNILRIPNLSPGEWRVCLFPRLAVLGLGQASEATGCANGFLGNGATLRLEPRVPSSM